MGASGLGTRQGYRSMLSDFVSSVLLRLDPLGLAPFLEERLAAARIAGRGQLQSRDPIGAEMTEIPTQLAPGGNDSCAVEETQGKRPDGASRLLAALIGIGDGELPLVADRLADRRKPSLACRDRRARPDEERRRVERLAQILRQHGGNSRQRV